MVQPLTVITANSGDVVVVATSQGPEGGTRGTIPIACVIIVGQRVAVFDREVRFDFVFFPGRQVAVVEDDFSNQAVPGFYTIVGANSP